MTLALNAAAATDIGRVRTNNEDSAFAGRHLVAVADGMGGLPAGELASDIVITALTPLEEADPNDPLAALYQAVVAANDRIFEIAEGDPETDGMGTTVTALLLVDDVLALVHVGDSRCYRLRGDELAQITKDDTFVQSLVDRGVLSPADARVHPRRSLVMQAVQGHDFVATRQVLATEVGDRLLVCSDGLSDVVTDQVLADILRAPTDPQACADALVAEALGAGGPDNITVVVADVVNV